MVAKIVTFADVFGERSLLEHAARNPSQYGDRTVPRAGPVGGVAIARVDHGRWIVDCPDPACTGAEMMRDDLQLFCCACRNEHANHRPLAVTVPGDRAELEGALLQRPSPENRNWRPGETLADLLVENELHPEEV